MKNLLKKNILKILANKYKEIFQMIFIQALIDGQMLTERQACMYSRVVSSKNFFTDQSSHSTRGLVSMGAVGARAPTGF